MSFIKECFVEIFVEIDPMVLDVLEKGVALHLNQLESPPSKMLCAKFGSGEED